MEKDRIAFYTGTEKACEKVLSHIQKIGDRLFVTTEKWLKKGVPKYKYLIFNGDCWEGYNLDTITEFRKCGGVFEKKLEIVRL